MPGMLGRTIRASRRKRKWAGLPQKRFSRPPSLAELTRAGNDAERIEMSVIQLLVVDWSRYLTETPSTRRDYFKRIMHWIFLPGFEEPRIPIDPFCLPELSGSVSQNSIFAVR
jgi:hypothetical protein